MRIVRLVLLGGLLAAASLGFTAGGVAGYGRADHPLAQIEYSENCNNMQLCGGGGGGVWIWIEIDGGPLSGTADVAGAGFEWPMGIAVAPSGGVVFGPQPTLRSESPQ